ncbi:MAG: dipeptidase [Candidatus Brocadiia bacterium]
MNKTQLLELHRKSFIIDGHADSFHQALAGRDFLTGKCRTDAGRPHKHASARPLVDYPRLRQGGLDLQFMAIFTPRVFRGPAATAYALKFLFEIHHAVRQSRGRLKLVLNAKDIAAPDPDYNYFLISIEGGLPFAGNINMVETFYNLGVRAFSLTQNESNELADGIGTQNPYKPTSFRPRGLTSLGRQAIRQANRLGMILDVAHLAAPGFWQLARLARGPIISSHTGIRALCDIARNLADDQLREIVRRKGVVGIFYMPEFIVRTQMVISIERVIDHIQYVADKFGVDYVGLGSDFDGYEGTCKGLEDVSKIANITYALDRRGFNKTEITKILGGNFRRVINQVLNGA